MLYLLILLGKNGYANSPQYYVKRTLPACLVVISNVERLVNDDKARKKTAMIRGDLLCLRLVVVLT